MAYSSTTPNLNLPQYTGTDLPKYIPDFNSAMSSIDTGYATNKQGIETNTGFINSLRTDLTAAQADITEVERISNNVSNITTPIALSAKPISGSITNASVLAGGTGVTYYIKIEGDINKTDLTTIGTLTDYTGEFQVYLPIQITLGTSLYSGFGTIGTDGAVGCGLSGALVDDGVYHILMAGILPFNPFTSA